MSTLAVPTHATRYALGEGPTWDGEARLVRWVDLTGGRVFASRLSQSSLLPWVVYESTGPVGAAVPVSGGGLLVAKARHVVFVDEEGEQHAEIEVIDPRTPSRLNDGKCDPAGRFVVGTLSTGGPSNQEHLVRIEEDATITVLDSDLTLSNGLDWSSDGETMYSVDTLSGMVRARDYAPDSGHIGQRRDLFRITDGLPDGLTVDREGGLWVAIWGGQQVRRYSECGSISQVIRTDAPFTTSATFAGPSCGDLIITSATSDGEGQDAGGHSGLVLAAKPGVSGRPVVPWVPFT